ncbi:MAG: PH domain-containing protein [Chitinophagaceae bacterium]
MSNPQTDWSLPQRQSWAALFIILYKIIIRLLKIFWPIMLFYLFRNRANQFDSFEMMIIGISSLSLLGSIVEFIYFRFYIQQDDLIIKSGFITKKTISLPLDKIQAVHIEQTWLHSIFNAARLSFDSAGSEKIEVKIDAIDKTEAEAFKRFILHAKPGIATEEIPIPPKEEVLIQLTGNDLFRLSISANHLEAFLLMIAFFFSAIEQLKSVFNSEYDSVVNWLYKSNPSVGLILIAGLILPLIVSVVISTVRVVLKYYDFRISRSEKGFLIHSGLVNIQEKLVPFSKVQYISWKANWVRQRMGLYLLHFHAIGYDDIKEKLRIKVPITNAAMIPLLLQQYHPLLPIDGIKPLRIHPDYISRRTLLRGLLPALVLGAAAFYFLKWNVLWLTAWVLLTAITAVLFQRKFRLWADHEALQIRRGFFGREELVLRWDMIQSVSIQQSIYQEGRDLATVDLYTAGGLVTIPYVRIQEARAIMNYALYMIESGFTREISSNI